MSIDHKLYSLPHGHPNALDISRPEAGRRLRRSVGFKHILTSDVPKTLCKALRQDRRTAFWVIVHSFPPSHADLSFQRTLIALQFRHCRSKRPEPAPGTLARVSHS